MSNYNLPGYGDMCLCGSYGACRCQPEPDPEVLYDEAYERGYDACEADGPDAHPLACWPSDEPEAAMARDWRRLASGGSIIGVDGRRFYGSNWFNVHGAWRLRGCYGSNPFRGEPCPEAYLQGFEDAACGLSSAVRAPEHHRLFAEALDAYEPEPVLYDEPIGPWPLATETKDWMTF